MSLQSSRRILLTGLLAAGAVSAQQPRPLPPGGGRIPAPAPGANPPNGAPAEDPQANVPLEDRVNTEGFAEAGINGDRLGELYNQITGRRVTVSNAAQAAQFRFVQGGPITNREAARLLRVAALVEGFVFLPSGQDHDVLVFTPTNPTNWVVGQRICTTPEELPTGDEVVTYIMLLKNIKPDDAKRTYDAMLAGAVGTGTISSVPNASSLIISGYNTAQIRAMLEVQAKIDVPSANVQTQFVKVQYADVTELAETLNTIMGSQNQQGQTSGAIQRNAAPQPGGAPVAAGDGSSAGETVPVQIVASARTNEVFIMGRPADILFVEGLIRGFDSQTDQKNFLRRKLKFLAVADFLPVAQQALERTFSAGTGGAGSGANFGQGGAGGGNRGQGGGQNTRGGQQTASTRSSGSASNSAFGSGSTGSGSSSSGGASGGSSGGGLGNPDVSTAPTAQLVGRTLLVADNITNSIVIQGPPASLEIINQLLDQIDVKAQQVMISCVFGQLRLDDTKSIGLDYLRTLQVSGNNAGAGRGGSGAGGIVPLDPATAFAPGNLAATSGLNLYGKIGNYMNIYLNALQTNSKFTVLSRPTVFMSNNQKGSITSGTKIAVPTGTYNGGASSGISTNFEYRDVELKLEVIPLVNSPNEVSLQIYLVSQDLGNNRTVGEFQIPDILNRELLTTVRVPNNETIVLGGLITSRDERSKNGIPLLSQVPWIGGLFGSNSVTKNRDELLIFMQPQIVDDGSSLYAAQADMNGRYKVDDLGREFIQGPGVVPNGNVEVPPPVDPKASKNQTPVKVAPEAQGGPRRTSSRPAGFKRP